MKGSTIFERLRADHERVLGELGALERAAGISGAPRARAAKRGGDAHHLDEAACRRVLDLVAEQFDTHMATEDEALFPALARALPEALGRLESFRVEHEEMRGMLAGLFALMKRPAAPERDEQLAVQARDFVDLLRIHVRKEEAIVFRMAEQVLAPAELDKITQHMAQAAGRAPRSGRGNTKGS